MVKIEQSVIEDLSTFGKVKIDFPMYHYTTFRTGGKADIIVFPSSYEDAAKVVKYTTEKDIPLTVVGGGSNLLVGDKGLPGVVLHIGAEDMTPGRLEYLGNGEFYSDALIRKEKFIRFVVDKGYNGVEFMVGIPGCIGGGIMMNAGTFMGSFIDVLKKIKYINTSGEIVERELTDEVAGYRKMNLKDAVVFLGGYFKFEKADDTTKVKEKIKEILADRRHKHPIEYPCAGSIFKNPEGHSSWKLVNDSGLKGKTIGGAMVSDLHTNFIINTGSATSKDIRELIEFIQRTVKEKFNVNLETEVRMIGEF